MSRRSRKSDGYIGCLGIIIVFAIIGFIMKVWPYLLLIAGCVIGICLLVKLFKFLSDREDEIEISEIEVKPNANVKTNANIKANANLLKNSIVNSNYNPDADVCCEVDRQIKGILVQRRKLHKDIMLKKASIAKRSFPRMKNINKYNQIREELTEELHILEGRYNAAVYVFREPVTQEFLRMKSSFNTLSNVFTRTYDNTPPSRQLSIPYNPKGDMEHIIFSAEPLCISLEDDIFCVIPYYVVHFKKSGAYVSTYSCKAIKGGVANGSYDERAQHVTPTYTRTDGLPDRRYKINPQRVYYTTTTHTVWNMLALGISNYQLKYEVEDSVKNELIASIKAYSSLLPIKSYDPAYHLIRLLGECDADNQDIKRLENIIDGGCSINNRE